MSFEVILKWESPGVRGSDKLRSNDWRDSSFIFGRDDSKTSLGYAIFTNFRNDPQIEEEHCSVYLSIQEQSEDDEFEKLEIRVKDHSSKSTYGTEVQLPEMENRWIVNDEEIELTEDGEYFIYIGKKSQILLQIRNYTKYSQIIDHQNELFVLLQESKEFEKFGIQLEVQKKDFYSEIMETCQKIIELDLPLPTLSTRYFCYGSTVLPTHQLITSIEKEIGSLQNHMQNRSILSIGSGCGFFERVLELKQNDTKKRRFMYWCEREYPTGGENLYLQDEMKITCDLNSGNLRSSNPSLLNEAFKNAKILFFCNPTLGIVPIIKYLQIFRNVKCLIFLGDETCVPDLKNSDVCSLLELETKRNFKRSRNYSLLLTQNCQIVHFPKN